MTRALWGPYQGIHGIEEFRSVLEDIIGIWESARWDVAEYIERGEHVIAPTTGHFKGRDGVEVGAEMTWVYTFGDGLLQRITLYQDLDPALEAAGLRESGATRETQVDPAREIPLRRSPGGAVGPG